MKTVSLNFVAKRGEAFLQNQQHLPYYVGFYGFFRRFYHCYLILRNKAVAAQFDKK